MMKYAAKSAGSTSKHFNWTHHTEKINTVAELIETIKYYIDTETIIKINLQVTDDDVLNDLIKHLYSNTFEKISPPGSLSVLAIDEPNFPLFYYFIFPTVNEYLFTPYRFWRPSLFFNILGNYIPIWNYYQPVSNINDEKIPHIKCSFDKHSINKHSINKHSINKHSINKHSINSTLWEFGLDCPLNKKRHCYLCFHDNKFNRQSKCRCFQMSPISPSLVMVIHPQATKQERKTFKKFYFNENRTRNIGGIIFSNSESRWRYIKCMECKKLKRSFGFYREYLTSGIFKCSKCCESGPELDSISDSELDLSDINQNDEQSSSESSLVSEEDFIENNVENIENNVEINVEDSFSDEKLCVICLNHQRKYIIVPCGHKCICKTCAVKLEKLKEPCPICRGDYSSIIKVYE